MTTEDVKKAAEAKPNGVVVRSADVSNLPARQYPFYHVVQSAKGCDWYGLNSSSFPRGVEVLRPKVEDK